MHPTPNAAPNPFDPDPSLDGHHMHIALGVPWDTPLRACFAMMRERLGEEDAEPEISDDDRRVDALQQWNDYKRKEFV